MKCLVIMPFAGFDAVFAAVKTAVAEALTGEHVECFWLKDEKAAGRITDDIVHGLQSSAFCIADLSQNNPNVMWETGYAMALGKPTILIGQSVQALPFDLKVHRVLEYKVDDLASLAKELLQAVRQTLARYELHTNADRAVRRVEQSTVIAVTGSMGADRARLSRRIDTTLRPYLQRGTRWYCGGIGNTDELVLDYLVARSEHATAVGYNRFDFSPAIRKLIEKGQIEGIDASVESLPKGLNGPSERDILFAIKAELVILFWDGKSSGTESLLEFFKLSQVSTEIAFV